MKTDKQVETLEDRIRKWITPIDSVSTEKRLNEIVRICREVEEKYYELIFAVGNKYPNESRHDTALRYIRETETPKPNIPNEAIKGESK